MKMSMKRKDLRIVDGTTGKMKMKKELEIEWENEKIFKLLLCILICLKYIENISTLLSFINII